MNKSLRVLLHTALLAGGLFLASCVNNPLVTSGPGGTSGLQSQANARVIETKSRAALNRLYRNNSVATTLGKRAQGVLVFPEIVRGGILVGGGYGDGTLYQQNRPASYYRSISVDYGLLAGVEKYGYALFLMDEEAVRNLESTRGWELGAEPSLTVIDQGFADKASTTTLRKGIYAFVFDQKGLLAGFRFAGTKVTRLNIWQ